MRDTFDIVLGLSVRVGLAEIKWSFFSRAHDGSRKTFLTNSLLSRERAGSRTRGAVAELDEASAGDWSLVLEWAWVLQSAWRWRSVSA